jgi:hypothetical protein
MSKEKLDDYELFYLEIPTPDYLDNIVLDIQDDHEPSDSQSSGLSNDQVSKIADDQLNSIKSTGRSITHDSNSLFANDQKTAS